MNKPSALTFWTAFI